MDTEPVTEHKRFSAPFFAVFTLIGFAGALCALSAGAIVSAAILKKAIENRIGTANRALIQMAEAPEIKMFSFIASFNPSMNMVEEKLRELKTSCDAATYAAIENHRGAVVAAVSFDGKAVRTGVPLAEMPTISIDAGRPVITLFKPISNVFGEQVGRVILSVDMVTFCRQETAVLGRLCRYTFAANNESDPYVTTLSMRTHPLGLLAKQRIDASPGRAFSLLVVLRYLHLAAALAVVLLIAFAFGGILEGLRMALYRPPVQHEHHRHHRAAWEEKEKEEFINNLIDIKSTMLSVRKRLSDMKHSVHGGKRSVLEKAMTIDANTYLTGGKTAIIDSAEDEREMEQNDAYDESEYEVLDIERYDAASRMVVKERTGDQEGKTGLSTEGGPREIIHSHDAADYASITIPS
ncbi:MAG: hypothetical protein AABZ39_03085 [Spirochaetota bacterium]